MSESNHDGVIRVGGRVDTGKRVEGDADELFEAAVGSIVDQ